MPTIRYDLGGILMRLYHPNEHGPPHVHVFSDGVEAKFNLETGSFIKGRIKKKNAKTVTRYILQNQSQLLADWHEHNKGRGA